MCFIFEKIVIMTVHTSNANNKIYYEGIASVPFLHFYHKLYYSGHTELDTSVGTRHTV